MSPEGRGSLDQLGHEGLPLFPGLWWQGQRHSHLALSLSELPGQEDCGQGLPWQIPGLLSNQPPLAQTASCACWGRSAFRWA